MYPNINNKSFKLDPLKDPSIKKEISTESLQTIAKTKDFSKEKTTKEKNQIIIHFVREIFCCNDESRQLDFLKIWPAFRLQDKLINIWINSYIKLMDEIRETEDILFIQYNKKSLNTVDRPPVEKICNGKSKTELTKCKASLINFLILGLAYGYLDSESKDIFVFYLLWKKTMKIQDVSIVLN
jgi:hypothetical protein